MDRNTNEDSKTTDGDGAGSGGDRSENCDRPRRRRSGDALRLQEALLLRRDGLLGSGSSASLDALDASPTRGDQPRARRPRVRSRQASEDLLSMALASDAALGMERGGERGDQQDAADGQQQAGDSTAASGLVEGQQRRGAGGEADAEEQRGRSGELPPPRLASIFSDNGGDGDGSGRQGERLDRDRMAEILSAALAISAGEFGYDEKQMEGVPERIQRSYFDDDKRPPQ